MFDKAARDEAIVVTALADGEACARKRQ